MPTKITSSNHGDSLQGSMEKRLDVAPDGTLWAAIVTQGSPGLIKFFSSTNGGSTWTYASGSDLSLRQSSAVPSFFIDADGYAHVCWITWNNDPQLIIYARGTPRSGGGWSWSQLTISPASGRLGVDSDIVAFRSGTGWVAWIGWTSFNGGHTSRVNISAAGTLSVGQTVSGPASGSSGYQPAAMEFVHTGDGRTPASAPSILYTNFIQGSAGPIRLNRALYSGGAWTWEAPVTAVASVNIAETVLAQAFDGARLMVAYSAGGSNTINVFEWTPGSPSVTSRNPPAAPGGTGNVMGLSLSIDPDTDDMYLAYYDATDGDIRFSKFTRATTTWSAWAIAVSQSPPDGDGKIQMVRHPPRDSVDMIYGTGTGSSWTIWSGQLQALVRSPTAPILVAPPSGALVDLAAGYTFRWTYQAVSPGDTQQGWYFRRQPSGGSVEYWNAATQTWGASAVLNTGSTAQAVFAAGKWTSGITYTWSVRTRSSTGSDSPWATDRTVVATSAPVVVATGPSGIVYGESTPEVTWTYTGLDAQRSYEVAVFTAAQAAVVGFDPASSTATWRSGTVSSAIARAARVGVALADANGYVAYVRATSTIGVSSAWSSTTFTVSIAPPSGPTVELRETIWWDTNVPRVRLDVAAQSNYMDPLQAQGQSAWESDSNVFYLEPQADNPSLQLVKSLKIYTNAAGLIGVRSMPGSPPAAPIGQPQPAGPLDFPVIAGQPYTAMGSFKHDATTPGAARAARVSIRWYDADDGSGSLISTSVGNQVVTGSTSYNQAFITDLAPPGAVLARVVLEVLGATAAGEIFYISNLSFAPGRSTAWTAGGYAETQVVSIERSLDGGVTWESAVDRVKTSLTQRATAYDRLFPYRTDVQYRARTIVDIGTSSIASAWSLVSTIRVDADSWAIRDPGDDDGEMNAVVVGFEESDDESSSVHRPAGRLNPVVDTEGLHAATGYITIFVKRGEIDAAKEVVRRLVPMVVQSPSGRVMTVRIIQRDYDVEALRHRKIRLKYIEVGAA